MTKREDRRYAGTCSAGFPYYTYPKYRRYDGLCIEGYPIWAETTDCDPKGVPYYEMDEQV